MPGFVPGAVAETEGRSEVPEVGAPLGLGEALRRSAARDSVARDAVGRASRAGPSADVGPSSGSTDRATSVASAAPTEARATTSRPRPYRRRLGSRGVGAGGAPGAGLAPVPGLPMTFGAVSGAAPGPPSAARAVPGSVTSATAVSVPSAAPSTTFAPVRPAARVPAVRGR
ncbi:hypothetical protein STENM223S_11486 [Streptomyces tendae]